MSSSRMAVLLLVMVACGERSRDEHVLDAATFRKTLQCGAPTAAADKSCELYQARRIESVRIEPRGNSARYEVLWTNVPQHDVVYAEFPGKITDELTAAGIPYEVK